MQSKLEAEERTAREQEYPDLLQRTPQVAYPRVVAQDYSDSPSK